MMAAGKLNILIEQGATFKRKLVFKDSSNVAIDLTGDSFAGQVRKSASDPTIIATFTCTITNASGGEVEISLTDAQTSAIPVETSSSPEREVTEYAYDIERTISGGTKQRVLEGIASVSPEVTKP
jgi:hypothetical protein